MTKKKRAIPGSQHYTGPEDSKNWLQQSSEIDIGQLGFTIWRYAYQGKRQLTETNIEMNQMLE